MPEGSINHPLFGPVRFRTVSSQWVRGDKIIFLSGFDSRDIAAVTIPQLHNIPGSHGGVLQFHRRGQAQLLRAFAEIASQGLLHHIKTCAGTYNQRLSKPTSGGLSKVPSEHSFGIAIDLNADDGRNGLSAAPVAPVFERFGFRWGQKFKSPDPMHFEVAQFLDVGQV